MHVERLASSSAMRMYTSYRGIRSTGGAAVSSGSRFAGCVLAATPSLLLMLMQLLIWIEVRVFAAGPLLREPGVEARRNQTVGALLLLRGPHRQRVGVLILDVLVVTPHPAPVDGVVGLDRRQLLPQVRILQRARLAAPAARLPHLAPLGHAFDQILRVGDEAHVRVTP